MANTLQCKDCVLYYPQRRPLAGGKFRDLGYGHCLARSRYAKSKPGNPVYPPGAIIEEREHNQHKIEIVNPNTVVNGCVQAKKR